MDKQHDNTDELEPNPKSNSQPILISTLELSGDEYVGWLIDQYKQIDPNITFIGLGGDNAKKAGMQQNVTLRTTQAWLLSTF